MSNSREFQKAKRRYNVLMREADELKKNNRSDPELLAVIDKLLIEFPELNPHSSTISTSVVHDVPSISSSSKELKELESLKKDPNSNLFNTIPCRNYLNGELCVSSSSDELLKGEKGGFKPKPESLLELSSGCSSNGNFASVSNLCHSTLSFPIGNDAGKLSLDRINLKRSLETSRDIVNTREQSEVLVGSGTTSSNKFSLSCCGHFFLFCMNLLIAVNQNSRIDRLHGGILCLGSLALPFVERLRFYSIDSSIDAIISLLVWCLVVHLHSIGGTFFRSSTNRNNKSSQILPGSGQFVAVAMIYILRDLVPSLAVVFVVYCLTTISIENVSP